MLAALRRIFCGAALLALTAGAAAQSPAADAPGDLYLASLAAAQAHLRLEEGAEAARWLTVAPEAQRGWEWHHLASLADRSLDGWLLPPDAVEATAFSPAGNLLATASRDGRISLWTVSNDDTGKPTGLRRTSDLDGSGGAVRDLAFEPGGTLLAAALEDHTVRLWALPSGAPSRILDAGPQPLYSVAFSPDGRRLAATSFERIAEPPFLRGMVKLWRVETGSELATWTAGTAPLTAAAWSPDGSHLAAFSLRGPLVLWQVETGEVVAELEGQSGHPFSFSWSADGRRGVSGAGDGTLAVWDLFPPERKAVAADRTPFLRPAHPHGVGQVAVSPDGRWIASAGKDAAVRLWSLDGATATQEALLFGHRAAVRAVAFTASGRWLITVGADGAVHLWDADPAHYRSGKWRHEPSAYGVAFSPDGQRVATAGYDGTATIRDLETGAVLHTLRGHGDGADPEASSVNAVAFTPDGERLVTASNDATLKVWSVADGHELATQRGHEGRVAAIAVAPQGDGLASAAYDGTVRLWDLASTNRSRVLELAGRGDDVAFTPGGDAVVAVGGDAIRVWSVATGELRREIRRPGSSLRSVDVSPDGRLLAVSRGDGTVEILTLADGETVRVLREGASAVHRVRFSPDGSRLATGGTRLVLWHVASGRRLIAFDTHGADVWHLTWSPDGRRLASASWNGSIEIRGSTAPAGE